MAITQWGNKETNLTCEADDGDRKEGMMKNGNDSRPGKMPGVLHKTRCKVAPIEG